MPNEEAMTVRLTFRTSIGEGMPAEPSLYVRQLDGVPKSVAGQMAEDFVQYKRERTQEVRSPLYRYKKNGKEVLLAPDFEEIVALRADESSSV